MPAPTLPRTARRHRVLAVVVVVLASAACAGDPARDPSASPSGSPSATAPSITVPSPTVPSATAPSDPGRPSESTSAPRPEQTLGPPAQVRSTTRFTVASFNVLGHRHTIASGNRSRFADSRERMVGAVGLLREHDVSVAGLQEFHRVQLRAFRRLAPEYAVWPAMRLGGGIVQNSVVWRASQWRRITGGTIDIPYFRGVPHPMPYLLLRHRKTGREIWFANFHNPASTRGPAAQWRRQARRRQARLANRLLETGRPVVLTGDMNERSTYACRLSGRAPLRSADGSRNGPDGCIPPAGDWIDWILGSPAVRFARHRLDESPVGTISDHPLVLAEATVHADD